MPFQHQHKYKAAVSRLKQDYLRLKKDPVPYVVAEPLPRNILVWHYVVSGPEDTPYEGGYYHGKLVFPEEFPFKPPSIYMITPNGRFVTNTRLCLSISDYHPDTWNPAWSVGTILTGLLSFMTEDTRTLGSTKSTTYEKQQFAYQSLEFNLQDKTFQKLFPELCQKIRNTLDMRKVAEQAREARDNGREGSQFLRQQNPNEQSLFLSALANIAVIVGFAAFAYTVKYILRNISYE
ncbi:UNVERIFIED_CONTAM: hypothetical protein PYX00_004571 [Menopon gallinae]